MPKSDLIDSILGVLLKHEGGPTEMLATTFDFLARKTDFYADGNASMEVTKLVAKYEDKVRNEEAESITGDDFEDEGGAAELQKNEFKVKANFNSDENSSAAAADDAEERGEDAAVGTKGKREGKKKSSFHKAVGVLKKKRKLDTDKIAKKSAFHLFCEEEGAKIKEGSPEIKERKLSKKLQKRWDNMEESSKAVYEEKSDSMRKM